MAAKLSIRRVSPWKCARGFTRDRRDFVPVSSAEDLIPPQTPGRRMSIYTHGSPDWRWQEADKIYQSISDPSEQYMGRDADPLIVSHIVPFIFDMRTRADSTKGEQVLQRKYPDIWWAYRTMCASSTMMYFLQAAALSGTPVGTVAKAASLCEEQVWWYEKMFFDVRLFLNEPNWIVMQVLYPALQRMGPLHVQDFLWKALAWKQALGWEHFLNLINPMEALIPEARTRVVEMLDRKFLEDTLLAVFSRTPNRFNENFIVDQYLHVLEIEKEAGTQRGEQQKDQNLMILMKTIQNSFHMASLDQSFSGVETRAHEELVNVYQERAKLASESERTKLGELK